MWPTPTSAAEAPNLGSNKKNDPKSLIKAAQEVMGVGMWPTPGVSGNLRASDVVDEGSGRRVASDGRTYGLTLESRASHWPTPNANLMGESDPRLLERRQELLEKGYNGNGFGLTLAAYATNWDLV